MDLLKFVLAWLKYIKTHDGRYMEVFGVQTFFVCKCHNSGKYKATCMLGV